MLISFSVSNYRSFGDEETLNMVASNKLADHPEHLVPIGQSGKSLLRTAVIYGANAAGKSNLVKAMAFAQSVISFDGDVISTNEPFLFRDQSQNGPTTFEFRFLIRDRVFIYGFDITVEGIESEWLTTLEGDQDIAIFERTKDGEASVNPVLPNIFPDGNRMSETLRGLTHLPLPSAQLLLSYVRDQRDEVQGHTLRAVVQWLTKDLVVLGPNHRTSDINDKLAQEADFRVLAEAFLKNVGTGVGELNLEETEHEASDFDRSSRGIPKRFGGMDFRRSPHDPKRVIVRRLIAKHALSSGDVNLPFSEESDGTQQLLHLMPILAGPADEAKVVVLDELDRSLHPLICWEFIRLFSESCPGAHKQLIVTTHEAHLLNQELLRRDEYWFVEKDDQQQSRLVSLSDFKVRNDLQIEKGYLQGRFGAIPVIGSMAELEELLEGKANAEAANAP